MKLRHIESKATYSGALGVCLMKIFDLSAVAKQIILLLMLNCCWLPLQGHYYVNVGNIILARRILVNFFVILLFTVKKKKMCLAKKWHS